MMKNDDDDDDDDDDVVNESGDRIRCFEVNNKRKIVKGAFEEVWWFSYKERRVCEKGVCLLRVKSRRQVGRTGGTMLLFLKM